jgi:hypothetical protein
MYAGVEQRRPVQAGRRPSGGKQSGSLPLPALFATQVRSINP